MKTLRMFGLGVAIAIASTTASAFQEQPATSAPPAAAPAEAAKAAAPAAGGVEFSTPDANAGSAGTEVRIPGLGKLGVLPKMDFGLELLYGAAEAKDTETQKPDPAQEDLMIRGTVKHRF